MYDQQGGIFPDNRDIMNRMKGVPEVKSAMKKLMPFVQHVKVKEVETCIVNDFVKQGIPPQALIKRNHE